MDDNLPTFTPGVELARRFYWEAVRPVLDAEFPGLKHSAALIGTGSEVLGFDTPMSADHHWGPRHDLPGRAGPSTIPATPSTNVCGGSCLTAFSAIQSTLRRRTSTV